MKLLLKQTLLAKGRLMGLETLVDQSLILLLAPRLGLFIL